jgi:hypothetical protein
VYRFHRDAAAQILEQKYFTLDQGKSNMQKSSQRKRLVGVTLHLREGPRKKYNYPIARTKARRKE